MHDFSDNYLSAFCLILAIAAALRVAYSQSLGKNFW